MGNDLLRGWKGCGHHGSGLSAQQRKTGEALAQGRLHVPVCLYRDLAGLSVSSELTAADFLAGPYRLYKLYVGVHSYALLVCFLLP